MNDDELKQFMHQAIWPYYRAFLSAPDQATLSIRVNDALTWAHLEVVEEDRQHIVLTSGLKQHLSEVFDQLSIAVDHRTPQGLFVAEV